MKKISFITLMLALPFSIPLFAKLKLEGEELKPECEELKQYGQRHLREMRAELAENEDLRKNNRIVSAYKDALSGVYALVSSSSISQQPIYFYELKANDANDCRKTLNDLKSHWNVVQNPTPEQLAEKPNPSYYESPSKEYSGFWNINSY